MTPPVKTARGGSGKKAGLPPRAAALAVLNALDGGRTPLDRLLENVHGSDPQVLGRDRALFNALVFGVLRWRGRLDWVIGHFSRTRPDRIDPPVRNILRLALFQLLFMDKVPVSAAVDTAVELTKTTAPAWVVRYVNGVLRTAAGRAAALPLPALDPDPVSALSVIHAAPEWLVRRWRDRFGPAEVVELLAAVNRVPPITLRANTLKTSRRELIRAMARGVEALRTTPRAPDGVAVQGLSCAVSDLAGFSEGMFQVQDEAAQLVGLYLDPRPGETVLDACAGLGGKTGHMAQLMGDRGRIVALDRSREKLSRLGQEMQRLGVASVSTRCADIKDLPAPRPEDRFHRILLDAPCSGLGVLRRNPDAKWRATASGIKRCGRRQSVFLDRVSDWVRPGGVLVYAVCSMEPEENEAVVNGFLDRHADFSVRPPEPGPGQAVTWDGVLDPGGFLRTYPHRHDADGFFAARLHRAA